MSETSSSRQVFINCPFDDDYLPMFRAIVFSVMACGFIPRSARELDDNGEPRIEKLYGIINESRYGIHDICRTELDRANDLPRFNMPLELGMFIACKRFGGESHKSKRTLIFDTEQYRYQMFLSDLAGMDINGHGGNPDNVVARTRNWLANVSRRVLPSDNLLLRLFQRFSVDFIDICEQLEFDPEQIPYVDFERIVANWLIEAPEVP
ncbi:hypothetical protein NAP1_07485 [Erythrobacter sp. NAP1]|uniref:hypothetical protein n=1 Tax=Erythrobacter sp. NAP1 TaxID=237727 RepID=UPI0000686DA6|nr:hypothetical protein [Erythrobacter sp. NAP1]EAQ30603.1 hypothetical protein NAP1_07485 [Erythrobacter sp. NAP1]